MDYYELKNVMSNFAFLYDTVYVKGHLFKSSTLVDGGWFHTSENGWVLHEDGSIRTCGCPYVY